MPAAKPFKFRYVNQIAGTFVAAAGVLVVVLVVMVGRAQQWFQHVQVLTILLPEKGSYGLKVGGEVRMLGVVVGAVDQVDPPDQTGRMTMRVHIDPRFAAFVCQGDAKVDGSTSQAIIRIPLALGDPYLEFTRGQGRPMTEHTPMLAERESGISDELLAEVRTKTLPKVQALLDQYTGMATDWRDQKGSVQRAFANIDQLTANLQRTDSVLGKLTTDRAMAAKLNDTVDRLAATADQLRDALVDVRRTTATLPAIADQSRQAVAGASAAIGNVRDSTAQLPAVIASLQRTVDTLPGVMAHTQQSLVEVEKLVRGLEDLPIIRDHVAATPQGAALRPTDLAVEP